MFNSKGQASSVFNILIAAVVSLAILGLLMSVMGVINVNPQSNPVDVAKSQLKSAINNPFTPYRGEVVFSTTQNVVPSAALTTDLDIPADAINFVRSEKLSNSFEVSEGLLRYTSTSSNLKVNLLAICGGEISQISSIVNAMVGVTVDSSNSESYNCFIVITPFTG